MEHLRLTREPKGKMKMEPTVTENGALYVAQHRVANRRAFFQAMSRCKK